MCHLAPTFLQKQLITIKGELKHKSEQIAACDTYISHLSDKIKMKEATVAQLKEKLQSYQQLKAAPTLQHPLELLKLESQTAELKYTIKELEYEKEQADLERNTAFQDVKAKQQCETQLHRHLGKVYLT